MLNIYRASAGSGKTYTLAYEYIKLLLGCYDNSSGCYKFYKNYNNPHRRILAVTFTNKATEEMKRRIVKELEILAHDAQQSDYCEELCRTYGCGKATLQGNAQLVLEQLLHDFSYFNISTIDSFFQQVLRAFTREVGLQGGYEVEMNASYVTLLAIDRMFDELDENEDLLRWLIKLAHDDIRKDKTWNIYEKSSISTLAKELTSEVYRKHRDKLRELDIASFSDYEKNVKNIMLQIRCAIAGAAAKVQEALDTHDINVEAFSRSWIKWAKILADENECEWKRDSPLANGVNSVKKNYPNRDKWYSTKNLQKLAKNAGGDKYKAENLYALFEPLLDELYETLRDDLVEIYITGQESLRYIYALGVLSVVDKYISEYEREHNTLLLSKTPDILSSLINESDTPFIYEKVGTRIAHYMIDEFQDTSRLQWNNFQPLINDSLDSGRENFIVGDVKQSIYRFRNSDWRLLHSDVESYKYYPYNADKNTNWRSCAGVVNFNNSFFKLVSEYLNDKLKLLQEGSIAKKDPLVGDIYEKVAQKVSPKYVNHTGHVEVNILNARSKNDFLEEANKKIIEQLNTLLKKGYKQSDIVFLVRKGEEGRKVVELLLSLASEPNSAFPDLKVVSDESLLISNAPAVKLILGILSYLQDSTTKLNELILNYEHELVCNASSVPSTVLETYFEKSSQGQVIDEELLQFFVEISSLPLYEMCEHIIHKFNLHGQATQVAYIEAFQDVVLEYCSRHSSDLYSFLRWWGENGENMVVKSPEKIDAITVMTVHKSKGLEYPVVIVPYATWTFSTLGDNTKEVLKWCVPTCEPFNQLPVVPIKFSKLMANTIYASHYYDELINQYVDNLNATYVAFTRAGQELIINSHIPERNAEHSLGQFMSDILVRMIVNDGKTAEGDQMLQWRSDDTGIVYELGADWMPLADDKKQVAKMLDVTYRVELPSENRLKQRTSGRNKSGNYMRDYGILMHELLSDINVVDDVHRVVQRYVQEGRLRQARAESVEAQLREWLATEGVERWFAPDVRVVTENDIIKWGERIQRPDRIVIDGTRAIVVDYKFGNVVDNDYREQVAKYKQLMQQMGYSEVEGYVWYVKRNEIVAV